MNSRHRVIQTLACAALLGSLPAQAQGIWRCGSQGNEFSDRPCADGRALTTPAAPSAVAVQQATEVARREAALASRLRAERLAQEEQVLQAQAALRRSARPGDPPTAAPAVGAGQRLRRHRTGPGATGQPLRVAAAPAVVSPQAARERAAAADARTSAATARGFPPRPD